MKHFAHIANNLLLNKLVEFLLIVISFKLLMLICILMEMLKKQQLIILIVIIVNMDQKNVLEISMKGVHRII